VSGSCSGFCLIADQSPQRLDVRALGRFRSDRNPNHPAPVQHRLGQVSGSGSVDSANPGEGMGIQCLSLQAGQLVTDANRLQGNRSQPDPIGSGIDLLRQPLRIGKVPTQPGQQALHSFQAQQAPELEGPEASAQRYSPIPLWIAGVWFFPLPAISRFYSAVTSKSNEMKDSGSENGVIRRQSKC